VGVGRKRTSTRTEKQEESSGELAHGTACCQGKRRMWSQKIYLLFQYLPPYIHSQAASLALKGCGIGNRGSRRKIIYDPLSYSTWKQHQTVISCACNWPSVI